MGIVIVTVPGEARQRFALALHETTGAVDLVIVEKKRSRGTWGQRIARFIGRVGWGNLPREMWYAALLRLQRRTRRTLEYFREIEPAVSRFSKVPPVLEVDSVNSDESHRLLSNLKPDLLVVWGSTVLQPRILGTARQAINLHLGYCPHYRGALANQHAVLRGDLDRLGATIHHINGKPDAGDILALVTVSPSRSPREAFRELNTRAWHAYLDIAVRLHRGEALGATRQDHIESNVLLTRDWLPSVRYQVGRNLVEWEKDYQQKESQTR